MKICVIGSSGHTGYVHDGIADPSEHAVVGVAPGPAGDDVAPTARGFAERNHPARVFGEYRRMLDELRPDVAVVGCRFGDLADVAIEALGRGCHVFMEKPVATELDAFARLRAAHARSGRRLAAMLGLRYDPAMLAAWKAVRDGAVGGIRLITAQKSYRLGTRPAFFTKRATYGGTIPWVGIHGIDLVSWFAARRFVSVLASHSAAHNRGHGDLEVSALCHFTLEDDVFAGVSIDYLRPAKAETHGDDRIRVAGSDGVVEVRGGVARLTSDAAGGTVELEGATGRTIFGDFLAEVAGRGECLVSAEDSFESTRASLLARQSADEGRVVAFA